MAYIGGHRRKGIGNRQRRNILFNWGVGIFYQERGYKPGYPVPHPSKRGSGERQRGTRYGHHFNTRGWLHPRGGIR